jgi:hypothetical protein
MNWDALGAIGEICGALVVIATLVFLSRQISAGNRIAQGQAMRDLIGQFNESMQRWADQPETIPIMQRGLDDYEALSSTEKAHFSIRLAPMVNQFDLMLRLNRDDQFPSDLLDDFAAICVSVLATPGGKKYWAEASATFSPQVADHLNQSLKDNRARPPVTDFVSHWRKPE